MSVLLPEAGERIDQSLPCSVQGGVGGENALGEPGQAVRGRVLTPPERSRRPAGVLNSCLCNKCACWAAQAGSSGLC